MEDATAWLQSNYPTMLLSHDQEDLYFIAKTGAEK